jgi:hypothetical protein
MEVGKSEGGREGMGVVEGGGLGSGGIVYGARVEIGCSLLNFGHRDEGGPELVLI